MNYQSALLFFQNVLKNLQIHSNFLCEPFTYTDEFDYGIRKIAFPNMDYTQYFHSFYDSCKPYTLYKAFDEFHFNYIVLQTPVNEKPHFLVIGPYTLTDWNPETLYNIAQEFNIPPEKYGDFRACYDKVPFLPDSSIFFSIVNTFCETIWGSLDAYTMVEVSSMGENVNSKPQPLSLGSAELVNSINSLETIYKAENELMQIVSNGHLHKVEMYINLINFHTAKQRHADPVRNAKNYAIIMNTLLRKAAESGAVHPFHIDNISSAYAKKIELQTSLKGITSLLKDMVRKYTLLVKNHSLHGYSPLIRKVLVQIDTDLSADLTLAKQAQLLDMNPSYLSTLFKKETGLTLTEFVTKRRIEHAVFLLNSTNMQIQTIAQYCGIEDVCYFTKLFKRHIGKTPSEYRNAIHK